MKPPPAPISVPKVPMANPSATRVRASRPVISMGLGRAGLGRPPCGELRIGQPRALERVPSQPAAERLEGQDVLGGDVAEVDVRAEPEDEVPLLGTERCLPQDP